MDNDSLGLCVAVSLGIIIGISSGETIFDAQWLAMYFFIIGTILIFLSKIFLGTADAQNTSNFGNLQIEELSTLGVNSKNIKNVRKKREILELKQKKNKKRNNQNIIFTLIGTMVFIIILYNSSIQ